MGDVPDVTDDITDGYDLSRYRFSATASAIYFLESMPATSRAHLRSIVLDEDYESVARPEGHALGLIPFCAENPLLRVERRAALWWNVLQPCPNSFEPTPHTRVRFASTQGHTWRLASAHITRNVAGWIAEALALEAAGMPPAFFSLVLDAGPAPQLAADIFQRVVQRDAVWQSAWEEYLKRREGFREGLPSWPVRRSDIAKAERYRGFLYDDFPQALRDMAAGSSVVRCTFDVGGEEWNLGEIFEAQRDWTPRQWDKGWFTHDPPAWEMVEPLPSWRTLMEETVFP